MSKVIHPVVRLIKPKHPPKPIHAYAHIIKRKEPPKPIHAEVSFIDPNKRWLTVADACVYLDLSPSTIRRILHDGRIKAVRFGMEFRIDRIELDAYLQRQKTTIKPYRKGTAPWVKESKPWLKRRKRAAR